MRGILRPIMFLVMGLVLVPVLSAFAGQDNQPEHKERIRDTAQLNRVKVDLELEEASVQDALKALLAKVSVDYFVVLEGGSRGKLSLGVHKVPFEGALVSILKSVDFVDLEYTGEQGLLSILNPSSDTSNKRVWMDVRSADIRFMIKTFMRSVKSNYTLDQRVGGRVTLKLDASPWHTAFDKLLKAANPPLQTRVEDGVMMFSAKESP